ncbi:MAG: lipid-A-disaccharide synthase [Opitutales bacterium]|nr:lipid-A-disaccharide synthase [Opitutales bacterium]
MQKIVFNEAAEYPDLLVIAGEYSGDEHASTFVRQLKAERPTCNICAIGGENLEKTGVDFIFNLVDYSVIGTTEVLKHLRFFMRFLKTTCDWIERNRPKAVCFVDFPGLNLRIAKELYRRGISHKAGGNVKLYYYISPQIWAWRAKRRFRIAKYIDSLGAIFPFEKECYRDTPLEVQFLGHPFLDEGYELPVHYDPEGPLLLLPGSRVGAVQKVFPIMLEAVQQLKKLGESRELVVIYPDDDILSILEKQSQRCKGLTISFVRSGACQIGACAALMSPGTMSLKCALAGIPGVIVYKVNTVTYGLAKILLKVKFLYMASILLKRAVAPEFLQFSAKPKLISKAVRAAMNDLAIRQQAADDAEELKHILSAEPQMNVVRWIQEAL